MSTISAALGNSGAVLNNQTWNIADNGDDATASTACTRTGGDLTQASPLSVANTTISMPFWFTCTVPTPNGLTALLRTERDRTDPLRLGANETYREAITLAADHVGYPRATIAAVISAEAGLLRGRRLDAATNERFFGKLHPDLDSKAKLDKAETTEWRALRKSLSATWDPRSYNTVSKAAGLTQFLESTWIEVATTPGSYVNQKAKELGLVSIANKVLDRAALLDLRFDATASIVAAAELDKGYFTQLSARTNNDGTPLVPANLTADQKARYIYLVHHEGAGGAVQILKGTLTLSVYLPRPCTKPRPAESFAADEPC